MYAYIGYPGECAYWAKRNELDTGEFIHAAEPADLAGLSGLTIAVGAANTHEQQAVLDLAERLVAEGRAVWMDS